jgi:hypothetical protein
MLAGKHESSIRQGEPIRVLAPALPFSRSDEVMPLPRENRHWARRSILRVSALSIALVLSFIILAGPLFGQLPKSASPASTSTQPAQKIDPLGRETPRRSSKSTSP